MKNILLDQDYNTYLTGYSFLKYFGLDFAFEEK